MPTLPCTDAICSRICAAVAERPIFRNASSTSNVPSQASDIAFSGRLKRVEVAFERALRRARRHGFRRERRGARKVEFLRCECGVGVHLGVAQVRSGRENREAEARFGRIAQDGAERGPGCPSHQDLGARCLDLRHLRADAEIAGIEVFVCNDRHRAAHLAKHLIDVLIGVLAGCIGGGDERDLRPCAHREELLRSRERVERRDAAREEEAPRFRMDAGGKAVKQGPVRHERCHGAAK